MRPGGRRRLTAACFIIERDAAGPGVGSGVGSGATVAKRRRARGRGNRARPRRVGADPASIAPSPEHADQGRPGRRARGSLLLGAMLAARTRRCRRRPHRRGRQGAAPPPLRRPRPRLDVDALIDRLQAALDAGRRGSALVTRGTTSATRRPHRRPRQPSTPRPKRRRSPLSYRSPRRWHAGRRGAPPRTAPPRGRPPGSFRGSRPSSLLRPRPADPSSPAPRQQSRRWMRWGAALAALDDDDPRCALTELDGAQDALYKMCSTGRTRRRPAFLARHDRWLADCGATYRGGQPGG